MATLALTTPTDNPQNVRGCRQPAISQRAVGKVRKPELEHEEVALEWILEKLGIELAKALTMGEYNRIKSENKQDQDYGEFVHLMEKVTNKRLVACKTDELSKECPMATVINHYHQEGRKSGRLRTISGSAPLRVYTIIGSDGQIINLQGFDLSRTIKITVRHTDGKMDFEQVDPSDAIKRIRREAGYSQ